MRIIARACKERTDYVAYLSKHIKQLEIIWDTAQDAMRTFLTAMKSASNDACVHIEDDIVLTRNFQSKLNLAISERPNDIIQFFSMRKADIEIGSRYDYGRTFLMNQCFYLPAGMSLTIANHYEAWPGKKEHPTGYDLLMADYFKKNKLKYWIHVPSLVDHRGCKSIINPRRSRSRQSLTFVDGVYE